MKGAYVYKPKTDNLYGWGKKFNEATGTRIDHYGHPIKAGGTAALKAPVEDFVGWKGASKLAQYGKVAGIAGTALTVEGNAAEYVGDGVQGNDVQDFAVDTGVDLAGAAVAAGTGAAVGCLILPPAGTIVGALVGFGWACSSTLICLDQARRRRMWPKTRSRIRTGDMVKKKVGELTVVEANRTYFMALATTRASMGTLATLAVLIMVLLGIWNFVVLNAFSSFKGYEVLSNLTAVNAGLMWISALFFVLSLFKTLIYGFQVFFSTLMAGMAVGLVYSVYLLFLPIATFSKAQGKESSALLFNIAGLITVGLLAGSTVVHVLLLRRRLRVGHSEKRTIGNYVAVSRANISKMLWINFGLVAVVVPNVLTAGQYVQNSIGIIGLIFLAYVMTSLPVEFAYLAYLKSKDRVYWETPPRGRSKQERLRVAKKVGLWVFGVVAALVLFWVLAKYLLVWLG